MEILRVDPDDRAALEAFSAINIESESFENDYPTPYTVEEQREELRNDESSAQFEGFLGRDGDTPVATGTLELPLSDNLDKVWAFVHVWPASRGRGHGSEMARFLVERARRLGRSTVITIVIYPFTGDEDHPYRRFATLRGFAFSQADVHRVRHLPADEALLADLASGAAVHHSAYELIDFVGVPPDEIREDYCVLLNQILVDAPSGDIEFEEGRLTPQMLVERERVSSASGRTTYTTVALDGAGVPVAHNQLVVPGHDPGKIFNWDTLVRRDHRGHRLGIATKVRNLRLVCSVHPDRTTVHTWNAESNSHMIAVNEAMGFEPVAYLGEYVRTL